MDAFKRNNNNNNNNNNNKRSHEVNPNPKKEFYY